jgi:hypothetical protein
LCADAELSRLRAELAALAEELALAEAGLAEAGLAEAKALLRAFGRAHDRLLAPLRAELDEVEALIAKARATASDGCDDIRDAREARAQAEPAAPADDARPQDQAGQPRLESPPAEARALYRALARLCHPDLGVDAADRERRRVFMIRVNEACAQGDAGLLELLAAEWSATSPP